MPTTLQQKKQTYFIKKCTVNKTKTNMPKKFKFGEERRDCTLAFVITRTQWDRFNDLKRKGEHQPDLMRSILFEWMDKREAENKQ